jgi:hypothetical protein
MVAWLFRHGMTMLTAGGRSALGNGIFSVGSKVALDAVFAERLGANTNRSPTR